MFLLITGNQTSGILICKQLNQINMDFYKLIQEQGFNGHTAMDIGCILALSSVEKSKEEYLKDNNNAVKAEEALEEGLKKALKLI